MTGNDWGWTLPTSNQIITEIAAALRKVQEAEADLEYWNNQARIRALEIEKEAKK
jgi:hypothetical protein